MSARKTVRVEYVKERANYFLANSHDDQAAERVATFALLECVLHEANAYKGFNYLPGVMDFSGDVPEQVGDDTRRFYY